MTSHATIDYLQLPAFMQNCSNPDHLGMPDLTHVIVVEKETVFSQLIQSAWFNHSPGKLIVTAKGYPDFATRQFLTLLAQRPGLKLLYLGDADPYGADIFFKYLFGSVNCAINQGESACVTLTNLTWIGPFMEMRKELPKSQVLQMTRKDQYKAY